MTRDQLAFILERVATWPEAAQDELLSSFNAIEARHVGVYQLSDDERAAVKRGLAEMHARDLASEDDVAAVFDRFR